MRVSPSVQVNLYPATAHASLSSLALSFDQIDSLSYVTAPVSTCTSCMWYRRERDRLSSEGGVVPPFDLRLEHASGFRF